MAKPRSAAQKAAQLKASKVSAMKRRLAKTTTGRAVSTGRQRKEAELNKTRKMMRPKAKDGTPLRSRISAGPRDAFNVSTKYPSTPTPLKDGRFTVDKKTGEFKNQFGQTISEKQYRKGVAGERIAAGTTAWIKSINHK